MKNLFRSRKNVRAIVNKIGPTAFSYSRQWRTKGLKFWKIIPYTLAYYNKYTWNFKKRELKMSLGGGIVVSYKIPVYKLHPVLRAVKLTVPVGVGFSMGSAYTKRFGKCDDLDLKFKPLYCKI